MEISFENVSDHTVARVGEKRLSFNNARVFSDRIVEVMNDLGGKLVVDLSKTEEMDSSGLGALMTLQAEASNWEGKVKLVAKYPKLINVLEVTKVEKFFEIYDSVSAAVDG